MTSLDQTPYSLPASAPQRRPGLAVFFALIPLPINFALNSVLAGVTTDAGVSLLLTVGQLTIALALEATAVTLAIRVLSQRRKNRAPTSGTAILAIVVAVIIAIFMVASTVLYYMLAANGIFV